MNTSKLHHNLLRCSHRGMDLRLFLNEHFKIYSTNISYLMVIKRLEKQMPLSQ